MSQICQLLFPEFQHVKKNFGPGPKVVQNIGLGLIFLKISVPPGPRFFKDFGPGLKILVCVVFVCFHLLLQCNV